MDVKKRGRLFVVQGISILVVVRVEPSSGKTIMSGPWGKDTQDEKSAGMKAEW